MSDPPPTLGRYMGRDIVRMVDLPDRDGRDLHLRDGGIVFIRNEGFEYSGVELYSTGLKIYLPVVHVKILDSIDRKPKSSPTRPAKRTHAVADFGFGGWRQQKGRGGLGPGLT